MTTAKKVKPETVTLAEETKLAKARRYDPGEYPQTVVRWVKAKNEKGEEYEARETRIVADPVEMEAALKEGWEDPTP